MIDWNPSFGNGLWDPGEGDEWNDCGIDNICPDDPNWQAQDVGEGDGMFNVAMDLDGTEANGIWDGSYFMMQMEMEPGHLMN